MSRRCMDKYGVTPEEMQERMEFDGNCSISMEKNYWGECESETINMLLIKEEYWDVEKANNRDEKVKSVYAGG